MTQSSFLHPARTLRAAKLQDGMRVADFGCGSGHFTHAAARMVGGAGLVWAVDAQQDLLSRVKNLALQEGLTNVEVLHGNIEAAQGSHLPAENFDFVILANVLFAAEHQDGLVREVHRVLRPGGRALVVDWMDSFGGMGPHPEHVVTGDYGQTLFELNGFTFVEEVPAGAYHWGFVVRKATSH